MGTIALAFLTFVQNDKTQANSYDDAWVSGWVAHCRTIYSTSGKTAGFVLEAGDSITHANPYSQWPRGSNVTTAEDQAAVAWCLATTPFSGTSNDTTNKNGWYLAAADTSGIRGMTASGGLDTNEFVTGNGNGGTAMPADTNPPTAAGKVADGATYTANLNATTVASAFGDAQFAVLMLGTNDALGSRLVSDFTSDLTSIVTTLEGLKIVVILSTIPPCRSVDVTGYNGAIRSFAQTRGLPLIDFYAEILAREPGTAWDGTLIGSDGIHPTASYTSGGTTYNSDADPYGNGGNAATFTTGANCANIGYLLRSWLTIQKLKEVKSYVVDGVDPPPGPTPTPTPTPSPSPTASGSSGGGSHHCGCATARSVPGPGLWFGAALILLGIRGRRKNVTFGRPGAILMGGSHENEDRFSVPRGESVHSGGPPRAV